MVNNRIVPVVWEAGGCFAFRIQRMGIEVGRFKGIRVENMMHCVSFGRIRSVWHSYRKIVHAMFEPNDQETELQRTRVERVCERGDDRARGI